MTQRQVLDEGHLFAIASATSATELSSAQLGAASTLVFEVYSDNSVIGKLNDEPFELIGCQSGSLCLAADFTKALKAKVTRTDYSKHCAETL